MITRRSLISSVAFASASTSLVKPALVNAETIGADTHVLGPQVDQARTGMVPGDGISTIPADLIQAAPELAFVRSTEFSPAMALANDVLMARAMGPDQPLVAISDSTGEELWRRNRVDHILGISGDEVIFTTVPEDESTLTTLRATGIQDGVDSWEVDDVARIVGACVVGNRLIFVEILEDSSRLVARNTSTGEIDWMHDVPFDLHDAPTNWSTNGEIVVGVSSGVYFGSAIYAWRADDGEALWQLEDDTSPYLSTPVFRDDQVLVLSKRGLLSLDAMTGEELELADTFDPADQRYRMVLSDDDILLVRSGELVSLSGNTGEINWHRQAIQFGARPDAIICDGVLYRLENVSATLGDIVTAVRGYSLDTGRLALEHIPTNANGEEVAAVTFTVANGYLYLATDQGVFIAPPGNEALPILADPLHDRAFTNDEHGFSYSWDESWITTASTFMTPGGLAFGNQENFAQAAQYVSSDLEAERDFAYKWHANLGPDSSNFIGIDEQEALVLDFLPADAEVLMAQYYARFSPPHDVLLGLRVVIPLREEDYIVFEFLQAESLFEETIDSFATFFENLEID